LLGLGLFGFEHTHINSKCAGAKKYDRM